MGMFMDESILTSIKKMLGITYDYDVFDVDLMMHINSALAVLQQLGVGKIGFAITGEEETWSDFLGDVINVAMIKSYVAMKVQLMFDIRSMNAATIEAYNKMIAEFEWRANVGVETDALQPLSE